MHGQNWAHYASTKVLILQPTWVVSSKFQATTVLHLRWFGSYCSFNSSTECISWSNSPCTRLSILIFNGGWRKTRCGSMATQWWTSWSQIIPGHTLHLKIYHSKLKLFKFVYHFTVAYFGKEQSSIFWKGATMSVICLVLFIHLTFTTHGVYVLEISCDVKCVTWPQFYIVE
jgi:hypothetical protein